MIGDLFEALDALDVRADDGLLLLEHPDVAVDLRIRELLILERLECRRYLILSLVVKHHVVRAGRVIDFELGAHWLIDASQEAAGQDDVSHWVATFELTNIVGAGLGLLDHLQGHWGKDFGAFHVGLLLLLQSASATASMIVVVIVVSVVVAIVVVVSITTMTAATTTVVVIVASM